MLHQVVNVFCWLGVLVLPKSSKVLSRVPLEEEAGIYLKALGKGFYCLVRGELPLAVLDGLCSLPLDVVWCEGVMWCFRQPFCDNEEKPEN